MSLNIQRCQALLLDLRKRVKFTRRHAAGLGLLIGFAYAYTQYHTLRVFKEQAAKADLKTKARISSMKSDQKALAAQFEQLKIAHQSYKDAEDTKRALSEQSITTLRKRVATLLAEQETARRESQGSLAALAAENRELKAKAISDAEFFEQERAITQAQGRAANLLSLVKRVLVRAATAENLAERVKEDNQNSFDVLCEEVDSLHEKVKQQRAFCIGALRIARHWHEKYSSAEFARAGSIQKKQRAEDKLRDVKEKFEKQTAELDALKKTKVAFTPKAKTPVAVNAAAGPSSQLAMPAVTLGDAIQRKAFLRWNPPSDWEAISSKHERPHFVIELWCRAERERNKARQVKDMVPESHIMAEKSFWLAKGRVPKSWLSTALPPDTAKWLEERNKERLAHRTKSNSKQSSKAEGKRKASAPVHTNGVETHVGRDCLRADMFAAIGARLEADGNKLGTDGKGKVVSAVAVAPPLIAPRPPKVSLREIMEQQEELAQGDSSFFSGPTDWDDQCPEEEPWQRPPMSIDEDVELVRQVYGDAAAQARREALEDPMSSDSEDFPECVCEGVHTCPLAEHHGLIGEPVDGRTRADKPMPK